MTDLSFIGSRPRGGRPRTRALPAPPVRLAEVRAVVVAGEAFNRVTWSPAGWRCSCAAGRDCEHVAVAVAALRDATRQGFAAETSDGSALAVSAKKDAANPAGGDEGE